MIGGAAGPRPAFGRTVGRLGFLRRSMLRRSIDYCFAYSLREYGFAAGLLAMPIRPAFFAPRSSNALYRPTNLQRIRFASSCNFSPPTQIASMPLLTSIPLYATKIASTSSTMPSPSTRQKLNSMLKFRRLTKNNNESNDSIYTKLQQNYILLELFLYIINI